MTGNRLRWGIISTGIIAHTLAHSLSTSKSGELVAVASRSQEAASQFGREFGLLHAHGSYEALLENPEVDVVYIATPHPSHAEWAVQAARAKKHVLCEKPLAMNHAQVSRMVQAAREHDVFLMEAFMYRCHPQTKRLVALLEAGTLGQVKSIQATFGFDGAFPASHRVINHELGGGGILDVGCYPVSMARLVAGVATGAAFRDPLELHAVGHIGERSRVDEYSAAILKFPGDLLASVATSVQLWQENVVRIFGSEGRLLLREPWHPAQARDFSEILIERPGREPELLRIPAANAYGHQLDAVAAQIAQREASEMPLADSLGNALTLDRWRNAIGLTFAADTLSA
jgi:predicted dehydrogenase